MWQDTKIRVASTNIIFSQVKVSNWYGSSAPHREGFRFLLLHRPEYCCGPNSPRWLPWDLYLSSNWRKGKDGPWVTHTQTSLHRIMGSWEFRAAICPVKNVEGFAIEGSRNRDWRRMRFVFHTYLLNSLSSPCTLNLPNTTSFLIEEERLRRARAEVRKHHDAWSSEGNAWESWLFSGVPKGWFSFCFDFWMDFHSIMPLSPLKFDTM